MVTTQANTSKTSTRKLYENLPIPLPQFTTELLCCGLFCPMKEILDFCLPLCRQNFKNYVSKWKACADRSPSPEKTLAQQSSQKITRRLGRTNLSYREARYLSTLLDVCIPVCSIARLSGWERQIPNSLVEADYLRWVQTIMLRNDQRHNTVQQFWGQALPLKSSNRATRGFNSNTLDQPSRHLSQRCC